jgi:hypothetical protein
MDGGRCGHCHALIPRMQIMLKVLLGLSEASGARLQTGSFGLPENPSTLTDSAIWKEGPILRRLP